MPCLLTVTVLICVVCTVGKVGPQSHSSHDSIRRRRRRESASAHRGFPTYSASRRRRKLDNSKKSVGDEESKNSVQQHGHDDQTSIPVLLSLEPDAGPRDGGTWVRINAIGINNSISLNVTLRGVRKQGHVVRTPSSQVPLQRHDGGLFFRMPDLSDATADVIGQGVLVSLIESDGDLPHGGVEPIPYAGPLFFRLLDLLALQVPMFIKPCCDFKISGGEVIVLVGADSTAPAERARIRFRGNEHEAEVDAVLAREEWGEAKIVEDVPGNAWQTYAETPPWPYPEENVVLEVSWNDQQFAEYKHKIRFSQQKSLFGSTAEHISEAHLGAPRHDGNQQDSANKETEVVSVKETEGDLIPEVPGNSVEMTALELVDSAGDEFILARSNDLTHLQEDLRLIHDIFILTCAAAIGGLLVGCLKAPAIIGCLIGGMAVGPGVLDLVVELVQIESMAELGVCLLLFCIGLELTWKELVKNTRASIAGLCAMGLLCGGIVLVASLFLKTPTSEALCVGVFSALASTPVSLRAIEAPKEVASQSEDGQREAAAILSILVTQDIVLAALLAGMPLLFQESAHGEEIFTTTKPPQKRVYTEQWLSMLGVFAVIFLVVCVCLCRQRRWQVLMRTFLRLLGLLKLRIENMDDAFFTLVVLSYAFASAFATDRIGMSAELGAFLAGVLLASLFNKAAHRAEHRLSGLKDTFVAWFFASIGLVINPVFLIDNAWAIMIVCMSIFVLKLVTGFLPLWLFAERKVASPARLAFRVSWILAHVSEFGFVLASKGTTWKVLSRHVYLLLVGTNAVSLCFAPWLFRVRDCILPQRSENKGVYSSSMQLPSNTIEGIGSPSETQADEQDAGDDPFLILQPRALISRTCSNCESGHHTLKHQNGFSVEADQVGRSYDTR